MEDFYGIEADDYASDLAHHFAEAATTAVNEKLVHYSLVASSGSCPSLSHTFAPPTVL